MHVESSLQFLQDLGMVALLPAVGCGQSGVGGVIGGVAVWGRAGGEVVGAG